MNGTTRTSGLFWEMSDARQSETRFERLRPEHVERRISVSNNLEFYFLFCLFGLAIVALFLCRSMQALHYASSALLRRQVWQVFMYQ